jgi:hypothetical protein
MIPYIIDCLHILYLLNCLFFALLSTFHFVSQAVAESSRSAKLASDSIDLKTRLLDREKTLFAMIKILRSKIGEKGIFEVVTELEENGISAGIFLGQSES